MDSNGRATPHGVVVAGGGPAGLFSAWKLAESGVRVTVLEREGQVGGLGASLRRGGNAYSFGTHHLHSPDPAALDDFRELMGEELIELDRKLSIKFMGKFYPYPLKTRDLIRGLKWPVLATSTASLALSMARKRVHDRDPKDAEEAVIQLYGKRLYEIMFRSYTTKFWGVPPTEISATFVDKRMPGVSAVEELKKWLARFNLISSRSLGKTVQIGSGKMYTASGGVGRVYEAMARRISELGGTVLTSSELCAVHIERQRVIAVSHSGPQGTQRIPCDALVSSIPISHLVQRLQPAPAQDVLDSSGRLSYRALIVGGFLIRPKRPLGALFTYYSDRSFHRLAELGAPTTDVKPRGSTILLAELTCDTGDELWRDPALLERKLVDDLIAEGLIDSDGVIESHFFRAPEAYPEYFLGFEQHLATVKEHLAGYQNLLSTGRQGAFQFTSMIPTMNQAWAETRALLGRLNGEPSTPRSDS